MNFLTGKNLSEKIYDIIYNAEDYLLILSPFVQLDRYFKEEVFKTHLNNANLHIIIGFGKNETNINRSFKKEDIEYFTQFPNITIVYIQNLHAKYYGNEKTSVVTSMNLLDYSFKNNIEFGVYSEKRLVSLHQNPFFDSSFNKCLNIVEEFGHVIFVRRPKYKIKFLFIKDYMGSDVELDLVNDLIRHGNVKQRRLSEFRKENFVNSALKDERKKIEEFGEIQPSVISYQADKGFCIRCKTNIAPNMEKPLCKTCFQVWSQYEDPYYSENFCIFCGNKKNTTFKKPACYNCYKKTVG